MNATLLAALNDADGRLVAETEAKALAALDEDAVVELHTRVRRARDKYVGQYRRAASARVSAKGGRGAARPANERAGLKAEAFEEVLARVSRRLGVLARESAAGLRRERLAAARPASTGRTATATKRPKKAPAGSAPDGRPGSTRTPATEKARASTQAAGARGQAKRDSR